MATSMGLQEGPEGMKKLTQMMKQGKIGMKELFNFLDMAAKRAKETGAYDLAINSKTATETRMMNSYKLFADSFGRMFDEEIKAPFKGFEKFFDKMTAWIDEQQKLEEETGEIGQFKTTISLVTSLFSDLAFVLERSSKGWVETFGGMLGGNDIKNYMAGRRLDSAYKDYQKSGGTSSKRDFAYEQFKIAVPDGTIEQFHKFANSLDPTGSLAAGYKRDPILEKLSSMFDSFMKSNEDTAKKLLDAKYNSPMAPVTINVQGVTDPMANAIAVEDIVKDLFRTNR